MAENAEDGAAPPPGLPRDVVAGVCLIIVAAIGYFGTWSLGFSEGPGPGPGLVPKGVSLLLAAMGVLVTALGWLGNADGIGAVAWRGPVFVLGSVMVFAAAIRPLGLAIAGPLAVVIAALADRDSRPMEVVIFAVVMTALCVLLFKYALRLPIPLAPVLLGY